MEELPVPPQVAFALGPALVAAAGSGAVPGTTARAVLALFPSADFVSFQFPCNQDQGCLLSVSSLLEEGQTRRELLPSDSLAGKALAARAPLSARPLATVAASGNAADRHVLPDVDLAWSTWRTPFVMALPLFRDDRFSILESCLQLDVMDVEEQAAGAPGVVAQYSALADSSACVGTITVGTRDKHLFCDGHLANLCLISCVAAMHLTADMPQLLATLPHTPAAGPTAAQTGEAVGEQRTEQQVVAASEDSAHADLALAPARTEEAQQPRRPCRLDSSRKGGCCATQAAPAVAEASGNGRCEPSSSSSAQTSAVPTAKEAALLESYEAAFSGTAGAGNQEILQRPAGVSWSQHSLLMHYQNEALEQEYVSRLADSYLMMHRVLNMVMAVPWMLLAGLTQPWMLHQKAPLVWAAMIAYVVGYSVILWCFPDLFRRRYNLLVATSWAFIAWFFPLTAGHIPIETLPAEALRSLPWLPFSVGCLTNVVVPLCYMPRFKWFLHFQLVSLAVNVRHMSALVARLGGGASAWGLVTGWVVGVSVVLAGALTYYVDHKSRTTFMLSRAGTGMGSNARGVAKVGPAAAPAKASGAQQGSSSGLPPRPVTALVAQQ